MNETERQEYIETVNMSLSAIYKNWDNFLTWLTYEPWLNPIEINGSVFNTPSGILGGIRVRCQNSEVTTDDNGSFDNLEFKTLDDNPTYGIHMCAVSVYTPEGDHLIIGGGYELTDLLSVGTFSGGRLSLLINFSNPGNNNQYVQPQVQSSVEVQKVVATPATQKTTPLK
jgi:hypothetical protein